MDKLPKRMTIAAFNAALASDGVNVELVKGRGYLYFVALAPLDYESRSEMVYAFNQLTPDEWAERAIDFHNELIAYNAPAVPSSQQPSIIVISSHADGVRGYVGDVFPQNDEPTSHLLRREVSYKDRAGAMVVPRDVAEAMVAIWQRNANNATPYFRIEDAA